jgi:ferric-dicitrate binding protein FerR (iron transport regulator)
MRRQSPVVALLAGCLTVVLMLPADLLAVPDTTGQRAGQVDRLIPAVGITRGTQKIKASARTVVNWADLVNTQASARARIALDDGSVLNVGSDSSLRVVKHDAGAQQTELDLTYGKLRSQAAKIAKPAGKFEVRTPAGVAGVVGTDFYVDFANNLMTVIVYENIVRVCNLAGACVDVKAGQFTTVRRGDDSPPLPPAPSTPQQLLDARESTEQAGRTAGIGQTAHHIGKGTAITLGILAIIPAVVFPIVSRGQGSAPPLRCDPAKQQCVP